jgi:small subunit ribosomal protein S16
MAVRLRLRKTGSVTKPSYRVVATDHRNPRDGRFIEVLGFYDPRQSNEQIDLARVDYWLSVGAKPSMTVSHIINRARNGQAKSSAADPKLGKRTAARKASPPPPPPAPPAAPAAAEAPAATTETAPA